MRRGISLMEVLVSIGIVAIGLVSILSLLPVGGYQAMRANIEERKAALGMNAAEDFKNRGFANVPAIYDYPDLSASPTTAEINAAKLLHPWVTSSGESFISPVASSWQAYTAAPLIIDPLMVAEHGAAVDEFPANPIAGAPTIKRLTVREACAWNGTRFVPDRSLSQALCMDSSDLSFIRPEDSSLPAESDYSKDSSNQSLTRQYAGEFSWLAMLSPTAEEEPYQGPGQQYKLHVVVFNRRETIQPIPEEMVPAQIIGDGEISISDDDADAEQHLKLLRPGEWFLLCRYEPTLSNGVRRAFAWNRAIVLTEPEAVDSSRPNELKVYVTVSDMWSAPRPDWPDPSTLNWPASVPSAMRNYNSYACVISGAVAVYQRDIILKN